MSANLDDSRSVRVLLVTAALVIAIAGMRAASAIIVPGLISVFIAVVVYPAVDWLQHRRVPLALAIVLLIGGISLVGVAVMILVGSNVYDFTEKLPQYQQRLESEIERLVAVVEKTGIDVDQAFTGQFDSQAAVRFTTNMLATVGSLFSNSLLILLTVVFILLEAGGFSSKVRSAARDPRYLDQLEEIVIDIRRYMAIKTIVSLLNGAFVFLLLVMLGIDYPLLWGLLAFLLNYIPNIGSIIAAVPTVVLALTQYGLLSAVWTAIGYSAISLSIGNLLEPRMTGRGLGLSTLVVFLSLVFWGWALGTVGALLSAPLTMTVKICLESAQETRWLAVLLGPEIPPDQVPSQSAAENTKERNEAESRA